MISIQFCSMTSTPGRVARCWAVGLFAERVRARIRWLCRGESGAWRSFERVSVVLRPVLPVAPAMRMLGDIS